MIGLPLVIASAAVSVKRRRQSIRAFFKNHFKNIPGGISPALKLAECQGEDIKMSSDNRKFNIPLTLIAGGRPQTLPPMALPR